MLYEVITGNQTLPLDPVQGDFLFLELQPMEVSALQPLAPQAVAAFAVIQDFHLGSATVDKHEQFATTGPALQPGLHQGRQPVKLLAHIDRLAIEPDLQVVV